MNYGDSILDRLSFDRMWRRAVWEARKVVGRLQVKVSPLRAESFTVGHCELPNFVSAHQLAWLTERAVEIPLALRFLGSVSGPVLEVGNVLAHYGLGPTRTVLDKYERSPGAINEDIVDYRPGRLFDAIVTISTLEHVGWDEKPRREGKLLEAFEHLRSLLSPSGRLFVSAPLGYNPELDAAVQDGRWMPDWQTTLETSGDGRWRESGDGAIVHPYQPVVPSPRTVWVAVFRPGISPTPNATKPPTTEAGGR